MTGTFILKPVSVNANDGFASQIGSDFFNPASNPQLVEVATTLPATITNHSGKGSSGGDVNLNFSCLGLGMYLDGSPTPIDTNNLPLGFSVLDCDLKGTFWSLAANPGEFVSAIRNGSILATATPNGGIQDFSVNLGQLQNTFLTTSIIGFRLNNAGTFNHWLCMAIYIEGTYSASSAATMIPSSGNVEPGQILQVTGTNVAALEYAALNGDQVIPIIPQIISPDEVSLEVPSPEPACDDCFDDCPECEDCLTACSEDLLGEACQACMEACLDCLVECMDDLEEGEVCFESVNDPEDPTEIIIICDDPGNQFTGSVVLGTLDVLVAEASGIYELVDGKTTDTLYATARDGTTYEVKIPNPNGKSGFFRS